MNKASLKDVWQKVIDIGLLLILILFPLALTIALIPNDDPSHPVLSVNFSVADLIIFIIFFLWVVKVAIFKEYKQIRFPPVPVLLFVITAILSFVNAVSILQWLKEVVQMVEYFLLLYLLLENNLKSINKFKLENALLVLTTILLILAFIQHSILDADIYLVRALFENKNTLSAFLCITIPLVYANGLLSKSYVRKIWMFSLLMLSYLIITSPSALVALFIGLLIMTFLVGKRMVILYFAVTLVLIVVYPVVLPSKNLNAVTEFFSVYEKGSVSKNYYRVIAILNGVEKNIFLHKSLGYTSLEVTGMSLFESKIHEGVHGESYKNLDSILHVKNRYLEMQAAINLLSENTLTGVGVGNFQNRIGSYYNELPKVNTTEPGQHSGYILISSTMGILGLSAYLWILIAAYRSSRKMYYISITMENRSFFMGLTGAVVACSVESIFSSFLTASLVMPFILMIFFSLHKLEQEKLGD